VLLGRGIYGLHKAVGLDQLPVLLILCVMASGHRTRLTCMLVIIGVDALNSIMIEPCTTV
jgi:hypothetical protein